MKDDHYCCRSNRILSSVKTCETWVIMFRIAHKAQLQDITVSCYALQYITVSCYAHLQHMCSNKRITMHMNAIHTSAQNPPCYGQMCHADLIKLNHGREGDGGQSWLNFSAITSHIVSVSIIYTASSKRQLHRNCLKVAMFRRAAKCSPTYRAAVCLGTVTPKDILLIATSRYLAFVYHNTEGKAFYNGYNVSA